MNNQLRINPNEQDQEHTDNNDKCDRRPDILYQEYVDPNKTDDIEREKEEQRELKEQKKRERFNQGEFK